jgi:hypothetical protein
VVVDDFGDVFGLLLAVTSDGFSPAEMKAHAEDLKRELSLVDGVARVDLWGAPRSGASISTYARASSPSSASPRPLSPAIWRRRTPWSTAAACS